MKERKKERKKEKDAKTIPTQETGRNNRNASRI